MRLRNQNLLSIIIFSILLVIIVASVFVTSQQTAQLTNQQIIVHDIQTRASNLQYLSNDYFLYQESTGLTLWQTEYNLLLVDLSKLSANSPVQQILINNVKNDSQFLNNRWTDVTIALANTDRNVSLRVLPTFQAIWSRMSLQNQALLFDNQQLSQSFQSQIDQLNSTSLILIFTLIGVFGAYFVTYYLITFRNTLKSISELQSGIAVIGSGNLDHTLKGGRGDEIEEISLSLNQMTANLKNVTASKNDLKNEIEERKKAEEKLEEYAKNLEALVAERTKKLVSSALYARRLIEASLDPLVTISVEGKITDVNKATELATGYLREELINSDFSDFFTEPENARASYKRVFIEGFVKDYPLAIRHKSGTITNVLYNATVYRNEVGEIQGVFAAARDITELKKAEEQAQESAKKLKDAERLAAIGATAGMVGHDIRNPLQAITGDLYLVRTELDELSDHQQKKNAVESLDEIQNNIDYINKIVADLQDYARPLNPRAQETNIKMVFDEILAKNGVPKNIKVTVEVEAKAEKIMVDPDYLKRIAANLTLNAVQAMPDGGKLTIRAYADEQTDDVLITVKDNGVGIPENIKPKMFTPMMTTKSKGQGFGLAVVKRMTEGLGGTVTFESTEGKGTTFIVRLPPKKS